MDVEKSLEYFIQCSLCGEQFKEAYILNCLHTFCEKCLKNKKRDSNKVICEKCQQESRVEGIKRNYFIENNLAARLLEVLQEGNPPCGNCAKFNRLLKYCEECREYLCDACVYCHENTKLTRDHNLLSMDKFEKNLMARGRNRAVFCRIHEDKIAEQYCRSCQETICRGCEKHREHLAASLAEVYSMEIPNVQLLLKNAIAKVRCHEQCASRCCSLVDELQNRKTELCDRIKAYFVEYNEKVKMHEEQLLQKVLNWYDKQFELIKNGQMKEEQRTKKTIDAVKFSDSLLKHGTNAEILSLKPLIHCQLDRIVNQNNGTSLITAVEVAIRNASWDMWSDHLIRKMKHSDGLILPEINEGFGSDEDNDDISTVASRVSRENDRNEKLHKHLIESNLINARTRGSSGVDGKDFHLGTVISKNGYHKGRMARDYRYDKILRNRSIGRPGSGCGEFQHPCDVAVDCQREDRLIVTDFNNNRVQVFTYFGEFLFQFGSRGVGAGQLNGPTGVAILHDGSIAVCDCLNNRIQLFSKEGVFMSMFGDEGRGLGQFWRPMGIAVDNKDRIIVVDQGNNRVQVFNEHGDFQLTFGHLGKWDGEISCPNFVAVDKDDNIYVSDEINMRVQIFQPDGSFLRKISAQEIHGFQGRVDHLSGIAVDCRGYVIVGVKSSCSVRVFTPDGRFLRTFSSRRACPSRLFFSSGIALTSAGEIVVADWFNNRIRFF